LTAAFPSRTKGVRLRGIELESLLAPELGPVFWTPERLGKPSAWWGHVPFAFWLIAKCEPRLLVELGTHYGVSYAAFCEAISRLRLATRCYAVDNWVGDPHAGIYGEDVYAELKSFHDSRYGAFSQLLRSSFDGACNDFFDGSIDVLHIDGFHTYEAVKRDFDTWRPKLSDRAVVLFHDTNERQPDFGVWRFFEELKREAPAFEFLHGHGLGVVALGRETPQAIRQLCGLIDTGEVADIRKRFTHLGERWVEMQEKLLLAEHATALGIREKEERIAGLESGLATIQRELGRRILQLEGDIREAKDANVALLDAIQRTVADHIRQLAGLRRTDFHDQAPRALTGLRQLVPWRRKKLRRLANRYRAIASSPLFDRGWYLARNPDVARKQIDPVLHYLLYGSEEGRAPGPNFDGDAYLKANPDVAASKVNPLEHYMSRGRLENRKGAVRVHTQSSATAWATSRDTAPEMDRLLLSRGRPLPVLEGASLRDIAPDAILLRPTRGRPKVSVIIPGYGQVDHTLNCLASIADHAPRTEFEILVVEDASNDPRVPELRKVSGIKLIENQKNLGFLRSCNSAAAAASGEYLYLLNNDTILAAGAIDELVDFAERTPDAGLVGSRLLYPDGRLQEAGGIVWDDASAWNYGRFDHPGRPEYQYVREADYISGASILVPRRVWDELGGFDEIYAPAYCEDSDLAFRVRGIGKKVYFQPASSVYHFEGVSHGTDPNAGGKARQAVNQRTLAERWGKVLRGENFPTGDRVLRARDRARKRRVILIVDHYAPQPDRDAGSRTMIEFIRTLQLAGWIVKFFPQNLLFDPIYVPHLQQMGVEVLYGPYEESLAEWLTKSGADIDAVLLSRPMVAVHLLEVLRQGTNAPVVYYGHDLHFVRQRLDPALSNDPEKVRAAEEIEAIERGVWRGVDAVIYPSQYEADEVRRLEPDVEASAVSAYCFDEFNWRKQAIQGKKIVFVAGFGHPPNVDAALWFVRDVFPHVRRIHPDATLSLVGSNPTEDVLRLADDTVEVTGWVSSDELSARYNEARVAVVPLRFGAGVKLKVVEALVDGVPLVTTRIGAQGLEGLAGIVAVTESAERFADAVSQWIEANDGVWLEASRRQTQYAADNFGRQRMADSLLAAIEVARRHHRARQPWPTG
jgi:GT2 family glycosyltransferase